MRSRLTGCALLLLTMSCASGTTAQPAAAPATATARVALGMDDLAVVDCRLPPKQRKVGNRIYPVPQRPIRTTAVACSIRGGEYTVYDRANYETSLKLWLAEAEKGDPEAQYYVAKLYEGALGTEPDYASAAKWYQKAAEKNHSASQYSLAGLYEQGLGVAADQQKALNLYRQAAGLTGQYLIVESSRYEELEKAAYELALREEEVEELQRQLDEAKKQQQRDENRERDLLRQLDEQKRRLDVQKQQLARVQAARPPKATPAGSVPTPTVEKALPPPSGGLGRFYALVIGNSQYERMPAVPTAERDAREIAALLRDSYGFQVKPLYNAKNAEILTALYELSQSLSPNDNLVVFYAGHGKRDLRNRRGWWLPVDAQPDSATKKNWLPNQDVSDRLGLIPARHILVLADASFVGDITRGAPRTEPQKMSAKEWAHYVDATKRGRARLALSSGTDGPVVEGQSSRFATALINVLKRQQGVVLASNVHRELVDRLTADDRVLSAVPTFAALQSALHEGVDFLLERKPAAK